MTEEFKKEEEEEDEPMSLFDRLKKKDKGGKVLDELSSAEKPKEKKKRCRSSITLCFKSLK